MDVDYVASAADDANAVMVLTVSLVLLVVSALLVLMVAMAV